MLACVGRMSMPSTLSLVSNPSFEAGANSENPPPKAEYKMSAAEVGPRLGEPGARENNTSLLDADTDSEIADSLRDGGEGEWNRRACSLAVDHYAPVVGAEGKILRRGEGKQNGYRIARLDRFDQLGRRER